jgi:hypothetical protein
VVHKLSSDRPALRRIGIDLVMREMRYGDLSYSRSKSIGFGNSLQGITPHEIDESTKRR